jgi:hypothetical protein
MYRWSAFDPCSNNKKLQLNCNPNPKMEQATFNLVQEGFYISSVHLKYKLVSNFTIHSSKQTERLPNQSSNNSSRPLLNLVYQRHLHRQTHLYQDHQSRQSIHANK